MWHLQRYRCCTVKRDLIRISAITCSHELWKLTENKAVKFCLLHRFLDPQGQDEGLMYAERIWHKNLEGT